MDLVPVAAAAQTATLIDGSDLASVMALVGERTGVDLACYRPNSIARRTFNRLKMAGCRDYADYLTLLRRDPTEAWRLLSYVTIKWSHFFRDGRQFQRLQHEILPALVSCFNEALRIWSAGCGKGEEPYSLAIVLNELEDHMHRGTAIYATDVDETALDAARSRTYPGSVLEGLSDDMMRRYFVPVFNRRGLHYRLVDSVAESVSFIQHDLLSGKLFENASAFHLVICRNLLIYFQREAQQRALDLLASSLAPGGFLLLGEAEQLPASCCPPLEVLDRKLRIYRKL